jgi:hypothetical protein
MGHAEKAVHAIKNGKAIDHDNEHFSHVPFRALNGADPMPGFIQSLK